MTREQAVQLIADALEGRAQETGIIPGRADRGRGSYLRQAEHLLRYAAMQDEVAAYRGTAWYEKAAAKVFAWQDVRLPQQKGR
jgi:hypothetical protein